MFSRMLSTGRLVVAVAGNCAGLLILLFAAWVLPGLISLILQQG